MSLKLGLRNKIRRSRSAGAGFTGLLDQSFASGATAAYSLRRLKSSATKAVRVREDSGNTETDIGFSKGTVDTTALLNHCGSNNGFVTKWYDQSGNGNDASNSTASEQPQIVSSGSIIKENGKPAIKKEQSSHNLQNSSLIINQPNSYTIVARSDSTPDSGALFDGSVNRQHLFKFFRGNKPSFFAGTIKTHSLSTPTGQNLVGLVFDSANSNSSFTLNKTTINEDPGSNKLEGLILFDNKFFGRKGNMKIQEFIAFDGNKDTKTILQEQNKHYQSPNF